MQICENIRLIRVSKAISATEMARRLGIPRTTYNNFEAETEPDVATIKSIAGALGVHYIEVIDGPGSKMPAIDRKDDPEIHFTLKRSDLERIRFNLSELGKAFQPFFRSETETPQDPPWGILISDNIKPRRLKVKKGKQKDISLEKGK